MGKKQYGPGPDNSRLASTIAISALMISLALAYVGYTYSQANQSPATRGGADTDIQEQIAKGIEDYKKQEAEKAAKAKADANKPKLVEGVTADDDSILGDPDAPVTIVEFSDYQCPFCKRSWEQVLPQLKKNYIDTGKVNFVYRDYPLTSIHPDAMAAAMAAECAGDQGKYFEMHDKLFENISNLKNADLKKYAGQVGLDTAQFNSCLDSETHKAEVEKDMADAEKFGVRGTPSFFINGWFIRGAKPYSEFEKIIEEELAK